MSAGTAFEASVISAMLDEERSEEGIRELTAAEGEALLDRVGA